MGEQPGVAIVIDGVPVQETTGKISVDLDNIETIRVIKGGASFLYGNDALAGAVVITTKRAKAKDSSKFEIEGGSFDSKRVLASTNQSFENSALQLQASSRETDGYWDDAWLKHKSINGKYIYYIDDSSDIAFGLDYSTRKTGDGNSVTGVSQATTDPISASQVSYSSYYDTVLIKSFMTYSKTFNDDSNLMFNIYSFNDNTKNYTSRDSTKTFHTKYKDEDWAQNGVKSEYRKSFESFAVMAGAHIQRNSIEQLTYATDATRVIGTLSDDTTTDENINAVYAEVKNQLSSSLISTLNARYDDISHDYKDNVDSSNNIAPSYDAFTYRAGLNYKLSSDYSLFGSASTGFRAPTAGQIVTNQIGVSKGVLTSCALDIENTYNYEIGVRGKGLGLNYEASVYQLDRKDYIGLIGGSYQSRLTGDVEDEYYANVGDMRSRGFELSINSDKEEMISFDLAYTYLDAVFTKYNLTQSDLTKHDLSGNRVPRTSKHMLNLTVDYKPTPKLTISPEITTRSSYYADELNRYEQGGFSVLNLRTNYKYNENMELFGSIDNLLDRTYYEFVNLSSSSMSNDMEDATIRVAPSRAFYVGMRYKF